MRRMRRPGPDDRAILAIVLLALFGLLAARYGEGTLAACRDNPTRTWTCY